MDNIHFENTILYICMYVYIIYIIFFISFLFWQSKENMDGTTEMVIEKLLLHNKHSRYQNVSWTTARSFSKNSAILFIAITSGPHHQHLR